MLKAGMSSNTLFCQHRQRYPPIFNPAKMNFVYLHTRYLSLSSLTYSPVESCLYIARLGIYLLSSPTPSPTPPSPLRGFCTNRMQNVLDESSTTSNRQIGIGFNIYFRNHENVKKKISFSLQNVELKYTPVFPSF